MQEAQRRVDLHERKRKWKKSKERGGEVEVEVDGAWRICTTIRPLPSSMWPVTSKVRPGGSRISASACAQK